MEEPANLNTSLPEQWRKLLLQQVGVNVCGINISGILTQVQTDHIIIINESYVFIIPMQHVAFIFCKH